MPSSISSSETAMSQELSSLRDYVETRFVGLEKWLERVTTAVEKQNADRERIIVLETMAIQTAARLTDLEKKIEAISAGQSSLKETVIRWTAGGAVVIATVTYVAGPLIKAIFSGVGK